MENEDLLSLARELMGNLYIPKTQAYFGLVIKSHDIRTHTVDGGIGEEIERKTTTTVILLTSEFQ